MYGIMYVPLMYFESIQYITASLRQPIQVNITCVSHLPGDCFQTFS